MRLRWSGGRSAWVRRGAAAALVALALATLASIGYAGAKQLATTQYNYEYCTTPSQYQYCSTSTSTTTTTTPTTTPTTTSTSTSTSTSTTTSTSTSTSTSTTTPTVTKPGKGCGDKNHLHERRSECKVVIFDAAAKKEGKAGTTTAFVFTVVLSDRAIDPVTVSYTTASGTAKSSSDLVTAPDFIAASGTLTIPAGSSSKTITVSVIGDKLKEPNETFFVNLSNPSPNAYIGDGQGLGTVQNDD
jgi:hypothetical protein